MNSQQSEELATAPGIMVFSSQGELSNAITILQETDSFELPSTRTTNAVFLSLREHLTAQGLRQFSEAELAEIEAEGLIYEPEDELIIDPYFMSILNKDREIQVEGKIYRYVKEGVIVYDASYAGRFEELALKEFDTTGLTHKQQISLADNADFIKLDYGSTDSEATPSTRAIPPPDVPTLDEDGSLTLNNGLRIPEDKINTTIFSERSGTWLSGLFGKNVTIDNWFDSKHRMKVRMYAQDFVISDAVGMTVRMQHKRLGIWWRRDAQEFRYGWTAMEFIHRFAKFPFQEPPKMPDGTPEQEKFPTLMPYVPSSYPAPYVNGNIVLFHVVGYDFTTGDVNKAFNKGADAITDYMTKWFAQKGSEGYKGSPIGIYGTKEVDRSVHVIIPQGEDTATGEGREAVDWGMQGLGGRLSLSHRCYDGTWSFGMKDLGRSTETTISRGQIYAAVKYGDEWRACVIKTQ
ncbi:MAG: hypothetical protein LBV38_00765 [Alistipes sp.]|nr:hypothetical protein [Alistipes sp.]